MDNNQKCAVGVDLGGSHLAAGVVSVSGELLSFVREDLPRKSAWAVTRQIGKLVARVCNESHVAPSCIGLGFTGLVNSLEGVVHQSPHFPTWQNAPVRQLLAAQLDLPFSLHNDASMFAYGEANKGAAQQCRDFILLTLGSGIGAGIVLDGQLVTGTQGFAGEVGHMTISDSGPQCSCGNRGCWELFAASQAFAQYAPQREPRSLEELAEAAKHGNREALQFWDWYAGKLAIGLHALMNAFGVTNFFLSGGIVKAQQLFLTETVRQVRARSYQRYAGQFHLQLAQLGEQGGVIGAALYSLHKTA